VKYILTLNILFYGFGFGFWLRLGSHYAAQTGLELLDSSHPPASVSPVSRTTGVHHHIQLNIYSFIELDYVYVAYTFKREKKKKTTSFQE
jgi:hypothetical protein